MKKSISPLVFFICCSALFVPQARANGWATAGKVLAGVAGADLLFNGSNSMVGRTVSGIGSIFTGGSRPATCSYGYAQPAPAYYSPPPPRRCWEETRREPGYDRYGTFLGYFDKRVTVCSD